MRKLSKLLNSFVIHVNHDVELIGITVLVTLPDICFT